MSTFSHTLRSASPKPLLLLPGNVSARAGAPAEAPHVREDIGLGAMRGLAFAMLCNVILAAIAIAGWQLWRIFH